MFSLSHRPTKKGSSKKGSHLRSTNFRPRMEALEARTMMTAVCGPVAQPAGNYLVQSAGLAKTALVASPVAGLTAAQVATTVQSKVNATVTTPAVLAAKTLSASPVVSQPTSVAANKAALTPKVVYYTVGDYVAAYLRANLGRRIGNNCVDAVRWALWAAGARYQNMGDWPYAGDYVWGSYLNCFFVGRTDHKLYRCTNNLVFHPGDVIQYRGANINGWGYDHHTAVVATVDRYGNISSVYEQSINNTLYVRQDPQNIYGLRQGYIVIYRPVRR